MFNDFPHAIFASCKQYLRTQQLLVSTELPLNVIKLNIVRINCKTVWHLDLLKNRSVKCNYCTATNSSITIHCMQFPGLFWGFPGPKPFPVLSRPGQLKFKIQGLSRLCKTSNVKVMRPTICWPLNCLTIHFWSSDAFKSIAVTDDMNSNNVALVTSDLSPFYCARFPLSVVNSLTKCEASVTNCLSVMSH